MFGLLSTYFVLDYLILLAHHESATPASVGVSSVATQAQFLPIILAILVYWGSTDFIEWGEAAAVSVASVLARYQRIGVYYALIAAASLGFFADVLRRLRLVDLAPSLITTAVLVLLVIGVACFAGATHAWPEQVPLWAMLIGAVFLFVIEQFATGVVAILTPLLHIPAVWVNPVYTIVTVSLALAQLVAGLMLIVRARLVARPDLGAAGLFLAMISLLIVTLSTPQLANVLSLPVIRTSQPNIADLKILVSLGMLVALLWLAVRRRLNRRYVVPFTAAFALLVGLQVMGWYFQLFLPALHAASVASVTLASALFVGAISWDLLLSGGQVTNRGSTRFPRTARVLLYLGYALFAGATFLYQASQHSVRTGKIVPASGAAFALEVIGTEGLGLPLLGYTFICAVSRWWRAASEGGAINGR